MSDFRALVVEDTVAFQLIYRRVIERLGGECVLAASFDESRQAVKRLLFHIAVVDLRLSETDEDNVDGLRVLNLVRETGDGTQCILITGYGTFQIAREAIMSHGAFRVLEKSEVSPTTLADTVAEARQAFEKGKSQRMASGEYSQILKPPDVSVAEFEYDLLATLSPTEGAKGLYSFYEQLLSHITPLIAHRKRPGCTLNRERKVASGLFWSKGAGHAILLAFGSATAVQALEHNRTLEPLANVSAADHPLVLGAVVKKVHSHGIVGLIRAVQGVDGWPLD